MLLFDYSLVERSTFMDGLCDMVNTDGLDAAMDDADGGSSDSNISQLLKKETHFKKIQEFIRDYTRKLKYLINVPILHKLLPFDAT